MASEKGSAKAASYPSSPCMTPSFCSRKQIEAEPCPRPGASSGMSPASRSTAPPRIREKRQFRGLQLSGWHKVKTQTKTALTLLEDPRKQGGGGRGRVALLSEPHKAPASSPPTIRSTTAREGQPWLLQSLPVTSCFSMLGRVILSFCAAWSHLPSLETRFGRRERMGDQQGPPKPEHCDPGIHRGWHAPAEGAWLRRSLAL